MILKLKRKTQHIRPMAQKSVRACFEGIPASPKGVKRNATTMHGWLAGTRGPHKSGSCDREDRTYHAVLRVGAYFVMRESMPCRASKPQPVKYDDDVLFLMVFTFLDYFGRWSFKGELLRLLFITLSHDSTLCILKISMGLLRRKTPSGVGFEQTN